MYRLYITFVITSGCHCKNSVKHLKYCKIFIAGKRGRNSVPHNKHTQDKLRQWKRLKLEFIITTVFISGCHILWTWMPHAHLYVSLSDVLLTTIYCLMGEIRYVMWVFNCSSANIPYISRSSTQIPLPNETFVD